MSEFDFTRFWQQETQQHRDVAEKTFSALAEPLKDWINSAVQTIESGGKIMFCGNGGSAADAQHIAAELSVKLCQDRKPIAALCLSLDPSAMTACANDYGYEHVFARQVAALGRAGDMLVCLTTSGNSKNAILAIETARSMGIYCVVLTGETGGAIAPLVPLCLKIPCADSTARIQEMHITLGHMFCGALERRLGLV